jgi:MoaA/NifB/PqqE/SkfB family radical SAM enzyme
MSEKEALVQLMEHHLPEEWKGTVDLGPKLDTVLPLLEKQFSSDERALLGRGAVKNLNDNPMFLSWLARSLATLSPRPLEKLVTNLIMGTAIGRKAASRRFLDKYGYAGPVTIVINPTMRCNIRCTGCYSFHYKKSQDMEYETLAKVLREARDMGVRFITVSGGEPYLYPHLFRMAEDFSDLMFMTYTNSTLLDDEMIGRIVKAGNLMPAISVEGFEKETDERRGKGVHKTLLGAMERLQKAGVFYGFSATPTSRNADIMATDDFVDYYIQRGALFAWYFNYLPLGRNPDVSLMPRPEQRDKIREATYRWQKTKPLFIGDFWNHGASVGGCLSASRYCYITVEGRVQPCTFVPFYTHRVQENTLEEIFESPFFRSIRDRQPYHNNLLRPCKVIDHPEDLRELVHTCCAKPSYDGAEQIVTCDEVKGFLDRYSEEYGAMAEQAWNGPDYQSGRSCLGQFIGRVNVETFFGDRMKNAHRMTRRKEEKKAAMNTDKEVA